MSEINVLINKLKESILNLIKINYNVKHITLGAHLVLDNIDNQNKQINLDLNQIYDPENRFKKLTNPTPLTKKEPSEQRIRIVKDVPDIKSSLKLLNINLQAPNIQEEIKKIEEENDIEKKKKEIDSKIAIDYKDKLPNLELEYEKLKTLLKQPLDITKIIDAVNKIEFSLSPKTITISNAILTKIINIINKDIDIKNKNNEEIDTLMDSININKKSLEKKITNTKSIIYLYDSQNSILTGGNYKSYYKTNKTNEKHIVSIYYILYKCYHKLLKSLKLLLNKDIKISYRLSDIRDNFNKFIKALKKKNKNLKNNYFQVYIVYHFLLYILNKFTNSPLRNNDEKNIYITFDGDNIEPNNLELIKLIILFNKSITLPIPK
jgi:hypothetical protein